MVSQNNTDYVRYSSWGRTRQPKNIAGPHQTQAVVNPGDPGGPGDGYVTENQRFLHLTYSASGGTNPTITVWAFSYAFGIWAPLTDIRGNAASFSTTANATKTQVFEITGVDRVYFSSNVVPLADDEFYAACSTF